MRALCVCLLQMRNLSEEMIKDRQRQRKYRKADERRRSATDTLMKLAEAGELSCDAFVWLMCCHRWKVFIATSRGCQHWSYRGH